jgi:hypothetical protein
MMKFAVDDIEGWHSHVKTSINKGDSDTYVTTSKWKQSATQKYFMFGIRAEYC